MQLDRKCANFCDLRDEVCASCTRDEFFQFLYALVMQKAASAEGFRSALQKLLLARGASTLWTDERDVVAATKAVETIAEPEKVHKGSLTIKMFQQLLLFCGEDIKLRNAFAIMFHGALRISEFKHLLVGDLQSDDSGLCALTIRKSKVKKRDAKSVTTDIIPFWRSQAQGKAIGDYLFEKGVEKAMLEALPKAAVELDWPKGLAWSGTHIFRIGGDAAIEKRVAFQRLKEHTQQSAGVL
jgi:hypothetical protein